jgi:hypothetical protein
MIPCICGNQRRLQFSFLHFRLLKPFDSQLLFLLLLFFFFLFFFLPTLQSSPPLLRNTFFNILFRPFSFFFEFLSQNQ